MSLTMNVQIFLSVYDEKSFMGIRLLPIFNYGMIFCPIADHLCMVLHLLCAVLSSNVGAWGM